jgi:chitinase
MTFTGGSTDDFCGTGCQEGYGGCGPPPTPSCGGGNSAGARRIGYYESWANTRPCDVFAPEDLDLTGMTHINFAFSFFNPSTFQITPMDANAASLYSRFTALKAKRPGLQTWLSVGGWSFNDATNIPNTQNAFSNMVGSAANRQAFINSLRNFMQTYGFDGIDIDWEYPVADDRGGVKADFSNFSTFLAELRSSFGSGLGISATLPSSYWYLQHFDLLGMEPYIDWFNFMSYDIHGVWDSTNKFTGPYIRPHTNLTEIEDGLSLLWRAGVHPSKVVLGLGWYGRSFTLADPSCNVPNGICRFTTGGTAGQCTRSSGTLSNAEIKRVLATGGGVESYDATAGVRWLTWNTNQWISYDDGITIQQKLAKANSLCLGGIMIVRNLIAVPDVQYQKPANESYLYSGR